MKNHQTNRTIKEKKIRYNFTNRESSKTTLFFKIFLKITQNKKKIRYFFNYVPYMTKKPKKVLVWHNKLSMDGKSNVFTLKRNLLSSNYTWFFCLVYFYGYLCVFKRIFGILTKIRYFLLRSTIKNCCYNFGRYKNT